MHRYKFIFSNLQHRLSICCMHWLILIQSKQKENFSSRTRYNSWTEKLKTKKENYPCISFVICLFEGQVCKKYSLNNNGPCINGGTLICKGDEVAPQVTCQCPPNYEGRLCENRIENVSINCISLSLLFLSFSLSLSLSINQSIIQSIKRVTFLSNHWYMPAKYVQTNLRLQEFAIEFQTPRHLIYPTVTSLVRSVSLTAGTRCMLTNVGRRTSHRRDEVS